MVKPHTSCEWIVKVGSEDDFVAAWSALGAWAAEAIPGTGWAVLLRDRNNPQRFVSFGPRDSDAAIDAFGSHPTFISKIGAIRGLLARFTPQTLEEVATH